MRRLLRALVTLVILALAFAYVLLKIDVQETARVIRNADPLWFGFSVCLIGVMVVPMAWRWQLLLRSRRIAESLMWLVRAYFVALAVGQVLPTSVGGDAARIYETARRHRGMGATITASVLVERALAGVVTLLLAAGGLLLALGRYPVGGYIWVEVVLVFGAVGLGFVFFSRLARARLGRVVTLASKLRVERPARAIYESIHSYRNHRRTLGIVVLVTVVVQIGGVLSIYAAGRAVGIDVSLLAYLVLGPLLSLVTLVPFTINGLGVREAFFVHFFARLDVSPDLAFASGFLYFLTSLVLALPGLGIILSDGFRRSPPGTGA